MHRARHKETGQDFAVKVVNAETEEAAETIRREVNVLKQCQNPHIITMYGCWADSARRVWILEELADRGSLKSRMEKHDRLLNEQQIAHVCHCCLKVRPAHTHPHPTLLPRSLAGNMLQALVYLHNVKKAIRARTMALTHSCRLS